jgi:hypothetical protein
VARRRSLKLLAPLRRSTAFNKLAVRLVMRPQLLATEQTQVMKLAVKKLWHHTRRVTQFHTMRNFRTVVACRLW